MVAMEKKPFPQSLLFSSNPMSNPMNRIELWQWLKHSWWWCTCNTPRGLPVLMIDDPITFSSTDAAADASPAFQWCIWQFLVQSSILSVGHWFLQQPSWEEAASFLIPTSSNGNKGLAHGKATECNRSPQAAQKQNTKESKCWFEAKIQSAAQQVGGWHVSSPVCEFCVWVEDCFVPCKAIVLHHHAST